MDTQFIMGMELLYNQMPNAKWYVLLDDDTFVIKASLLAVLGRLDPSEPHYLGNAVGDFRGRFGHGGSGILISGAAMSQLFEREDVVMAALVGVVGLATLDDALDEGASPVLRLA